MPYFCGMQLKVYKSLWGMTSPLEEQFGRIASAGYDGVENATQEIQDVPLFTRLLKEHTPAHRARQLEAYYHEALAHRQSVKTNSIHAVELEEAK